MRPRNFVIVGAGQAGCRAALAIRAADPDANTILIGAEPHPPYERPGLSKGVLTGKSSPDSAIIKQPEALKDLGVECHFGQPVSRIDLAAQLVILKDARQITFDGLMLATGSRVRRLPVPGADLRRVHYLRTIEDSLALADSLGNCRELVIVGAGFIGLEVAASAQERFGCNVTVIEAGPDILQRGAPELLRSTLKKLHHEMGTRFIFGDGVSAFEGSDSIERVVLSSGRVVTADCVLVGIGVIPETRLAEQAGLVVNDGIVTDEYGETSHPGVFAAGEVTNHRNLFLASAAHRECWQVAQNQSVIAANALCGDRQPYYDIPWFWTDQFGHNFQLFGATGPELQPVTRHYDGDLKSTTFFLENGRIAGALCINTGKDIRLVKEALLHGMDVSPEQLENPSVNLKPYLNKRRIQA